MPELDRIRERYARRAAVPAGRYSYFDAAHLWLMQEREQRILRGLALAGVHSLAQCRVLEVGCGSGGVLLDFLRWGARPKNLYGVDLLAERCADAAERIPGAHISAGNAERLDFPGQFFDIVIQATMFSSIHDASMRTRIAEEMSRVLKGTGLLVWYDLRFRNPRNPDVRPVGRAEIGRLFPGFRRRVYTCTPAPPLLRGAAFGGRRLFGLFSLVPALRTHYLAIMSPQR